MTLPVRGTPRPRPSRLTLAACLLIAGCASAPPDYVTQTQDPWESFNRKIYAFNDALDKHVARPVADTYIRAVPAPARNGVHNVIENLGEPSTIVNDALQGKVGDTFKDLGRFVINSTVGLLGWFDVAQHMGMPVHDEDLGQTLAHWGVSSGPYFVIPIIGPSTVRDAGGRVGDLYTDPPKENLPPRYRNAEILMDGIDTRAGLMGANSAIDSAYDPYTFVRDAYLQNRRYKIYDGSPPPSASDYDLPPDEGTTAPPAGATSAAPTEATSPPPAAATHTSAPAASTHVTWQIADRAIPRAN
ncbi:MAG: MlaA family lipoprotein [Bacillota bacterium]